MKTTPILAALVGMVACKSAAAVSKKDQATMIKSKIQTSLNTTEGVQGGCAGCPGDNYCPCPAKGRYRAPGNPFCPGNPSFYCGSKLGTCDGAKAAYLDRIVNGNGCWTCYGCNYDCCAWAVPACDGGDDGDCD